MLLPPPSPPPIESFFFCTSDAFNAHVMFKDFHLLFDGTFILNFCVHECCPLVDHGNNVSGPMKFLELNEKKLYFR
jgi:hypothetical protein